MEKGKPATTVIHQLSYILSSGAVVLNPVPPCYCLHSWAEVCVTLRNRGRDAYKPADYGPSITVEMRLTREGLRTYKLKNNSGEDQTDATTTYRV